MSNLSTSTDTHYFLAAQYIFSCFPAALFAPLVYEASVAFQATCRDYIVNHIFANISEDDDDDDEDGKYIVFMVILYS